MVDTPAEEHRCRCC